ncbi:MAG: GWxTD domain-containing protein [Candidatus Aminicenantia bacterium]
MRKIIFKIGTLFLASCFLLPVSCRLYQLEKKLEPKDQEFLSKVRFIITKEERKIFLELPASEREKFKKEFWKKRDPDPDTEENEFKKIYFERINEATRLFRGEGRPGWLTDRGRIYIFFGPPFLRRRYEGGLYGGVIIRAREIWYYGLYPVEFIDYRGTGEYQLVTTDVAHLNELNTALAFLREEQEKKVTEYGKAIFDFNLEIKKSRENELIISIEIPYKNIWFTEKEDKLETSFELSISIYDFNNQLVWEYQKDYPVSVTEEEIKTGKEKELLIEIPVTLEKGSYKIASILINKTGEEKMKKELEFSVES